LLAALADQQARYQKLNQSVMMLGNKAVLYCMYNNDFTLVFRGSLTLASQLEGPTAEQQTFTDNHKLAYQRAMSQQTIACTRCKHQFHLGQKGGCAYHPGAMDFTCKNEGRPNERNIFDRYECCQRTVLDTPGMLLLLHCAIRFLTACTMGHVIELVDSAVMNGLCSQYKIFILFDATYKCDRLWYVAHTDCSLGRLCKARVSAHVERMSCTTSIKKLLPCMRTGHLHSLQWRLKDPQNPSPRFESVHEAAVKLQ